MVNTGLRFNVSHAAGVTRYQVDRPHRHSGMYECVAIRAVSGTHHFIGSIQVFSRQEIERAIVAEDSAKAETYTCWNCGDQALRSQQHACETGK